MSPHPPECNCSACGAVDPLPLRCLRREMSRQVQGLTEAAKEVVAGRSRFYYL